MQFIDPIAAGQACDFYATGVSDVKNGQKMAQNGLKTTRYGIWRGFEPENSEFCP